MTNLEVSANLFSTTPKEKDPSTEFTLDYDNLMDQNLRILVGSKFIEFSKLWATKVFDFNTHAAHEPIILSNKLSVECYEHGTFGLAANQIGIPYKAIVVAGVDFAMFNPAIVSSSGEPTSMDEISPSFPTFRASIKRPPHVEIRYLTPYGKFEKRLFTGMTARIAQQLIEVVNGKSILDYVSDFKKAKVIAKSDKLVSKK